MEKEMKETKTGKAKTPKGVPRETSSEASTKGKIVVPTCKDKDCPTHGNLKVRGRTFEGKVTAKFHKRLTIEFERMIYVRKYERYKKSKTKIHARLPICMEKDVNVGDLIQVQECRPLSKIIHFVFVKKIIKGATPKGVPRETSSEVSTGGKK